MTKDLHTRFDEIITEKYLVVFPGVIEELLNAVAERDKEVRDALENNYTIFTNKFDHQTKEKYVSLEQVLSLLSPSDTKEKEEE